MRKLMKNDYIFIVVIILFLTIGFYKFYKSKEIIENGIIGTAQVVSVEHVYNQGLVIIYEYSYNNKKYTNRKSVESREIGNKYLNKVYEIKILQNSPGESLINLQKEILNKN